MPIGQQIAEQGGNKAKQQNLVEQLEKEIDLGAQLLRSSYAPLPQSSSISQK
ncbi:MAG: hypothetical protein IT258_11070 [Saprospiraceae bacterium]|nr:hypothetical protein [Saprospiraceae bacterium]